jgi:hypothetical protein
MNNFICCVPFMQICLSLTSRLVSLSSRMEIILVLFVVVAPWRKLHRGDLHNLYPSSDIIRQIKSRRMRWAGHVARMGEGRN